jgi:hypothetical protein
VALLLGKIDNQLLVFELYDYGLLATCLHTEKPSLNRRLDEALLPVLSSPDFRVKPVATEWFQLPPACLERNCAGSINLQ